MNTTDQERAEFLAWVRTHEECHGAIDEGSAWAAWQASRRAQVVPMGWRLVPIDPTPEMIDAADASDKEYSRRAFGGSIHMPQSGEDHWHAMLAAAPQPPEANSPEFDRIKAAPVQMPSPAECNIMDCQAGS